MIMNPIKTNQASWNKRTEIHVTSDFYNVDGFLKGGNTLNKIELSEVGDVAGKTLLHLQCHFGLDTLSWARLGAQVTGVDFSPVAIEYANKIKKQANLEGNFICSDIDSFGKHGKEQYDVVFTSYGVLCWLPCLITWAETIANHLKPGGLFYMAEFHPAYDLVSGFSYFYKKDPYVEKEGTYTENDTGEKLTLVTWTHALSDVVNALIEVGIEIIHLNEYPYSPYNCFDNMIEGEKGQFYIHHLKAEVPLVYSIKGRKNNS